MTLAEFFEQNNHCAIGYSGGVDSAFLLSKAVEFGVDVKPYFVRSPFTTEREFNEAVKFAKSLGCSIEVIDIDLLNFDDVIRNDMNRCYYCKKIIFEAICQKAELSGYDVVLEGTNASDDISDRPGFRAIFELGVVSPLKLCGITKDLIRAELRDKGHELWSKPSSACLATRIPCGTEITSDKLYRVKKAEEILTDMGFSDFRIRIYYDAARIQLKAEQFSTAAALHNEICNGLKSYFNDIFLDLKER